MRTPFLGPKSMCKCGHVGDGAKSAHAGLLGHGPCCNPSCPCEKFTWAGWTPEFSKKVADPKSAAIIKENAGKYSESLKRLADK